jgi:hypothetical protein
MTSWSPLLSSASVSTLGCLKEGQTFELKYTVKSGGEKNESGGHWEV